MKILYNNQNLHIHIHIESGPVGDIDGLLEKNSTIYLTHEFPDLGYDNSIEII